MDNTDEKYFNNIDLVRKIYANSWECIWNDALKAIYKRGFFFCNPPTFNTTEVNKTKKC